MSFSGLILTMLFQIPGGAKGVLGLAFFVPTILLASVKYFGLLTCISYLVPLGIVVAIIYTERELREHEGKDE